MNIIILEDNEERIREMQRCIPKDCIVKFSKSEFGVIELIKDNMGNQMVISLDHDLEKENINDPDPGDGRGVVRWLVINKVNAKIIIHTSNNIMGDSMYYNLIDAGYNVERVSPYDGVRWVENSWAKVLKSMN